MKKMLIAATAVGGLAAGVILYLQNKSGSKKQLGEGKKERDAQLEGTQTVQRLGTHSMG
jgi:hypothetical protein